MSGAETLQQIALEEGLFPRRIEASAFVASAEQGSVKSVPGRASVAGPQARSENSSDQA